VIFDRACARYTGPLPQGLMQVIVGDRDLGETLVASPDVAIVSATGSTRMGRDVAAKVAARFGRSILELGGNNAMIVAPSADLSLAVRAIVFSAVGTCGQRCTSLRRLIVHKDVREALLPQVIKAYQSAPVGNPLEDGTLIGPLIDKASFDAMQAALEAARAQGGTVHGGERLLADVYPDAYYVRPAIVEMPAQTEVVREETFAPILYVMDYQDFDTAIALQNDVPALPTSTSALRVLKSAARLAAKRKPAVAVSRVRTPGKAICAAPPTR
jgi:aldehyde dehydrogenase (NAD+)